jgi:hypothetical protein
MLKIVKKKEQAPILSLCYGPIFANYTHIGTKLESADNFSQKHYEKWSCLSLKVNHKPLFIENSLKDWISIKKVL